MGMEPSRFRSVPLADATEVGIPTSSPVPTVDGWLRAGELAVGDEVFDRNGLPVQIAAATSLGYHRTVTIKFDDHSSVTIGAGHLLDVLFRYGHARAWKATTKTVREVLQIGLRRGRSERYWRVPICERIRFAERNLPADPYVIGAFIANGTAGTSATISTPDPSVHSRLEAHRGVRVNDTTLGVCPRFTIHGLIAVLRDLGLDVKSGAKFIPELYLTASIEQRIDLLHGLMDGDGCGSAKGRRCVSYSTTSQRLVRDMVRLVSSLGGTATPRAIDRTHEGKGIEYTLSIMLPDDIEPFATDAKQRGTTTTGPFPLGPSNRSSQALTANSSPSGWLAGTRCSSARTASWSACKTRPGSRRRSPRLGCRYQPPDDCVA